MIHDVHSDFRENVDGLVLSSVQAIPDEFLTRLREDRDASLDPLKSELNRVCSVPVAVVERWLHEGFNIYSAPAKGIIARLKREGLDAFVTTKRRL